MPFDDPTTGDHQVGVVRAERPQRGGGLTDERCGIDTVGTRDVPEMLDRMHDLNVRHRVPRPPVAAPIRR